MIKVRSLKPEDRSEWIRLRLALWPYHDITELENSAEAIATNRETETVFVAERPGGGLCGMAEFSIRLHAKGCQTNNVGYIEGWFVDTDMRQKGVGRQLIASGEAWARSRGCKEMASDTTLKYPISPLVHEALGYQEVDRTIHFSKTLRRQTD